MLRCVCVNLIDDQTCAIEILNLYKSIEIPLFHVLNARITFTNLFSRDTPVEGVVPVKTEGDRGEVLACAIDESTFAVPSSYSVIGQQLFYTLFIQTNPARRIFY